ncbi:MAG TPA: PqqD family protein [Elusimicrobiales bacterium]|nr:PqqD family protein [Elusimicrobiales bacterium]
MNEKKIPRRNKDVVCREIAGETILVPIYRDSRDLNSIYTLNPSAAWVWSKIDGKRGWGDIKTLLLKNFDIENTQADKRLSELRRELEEIKAVI